MDLPHEDQWLPLHSTLRQRRPALLAKRYMQFALLIFVSLIGAQYASAAEAKREPFGVLDDGSSIEAVVLSNKSGTTVRLMTLGATIQSLRVPDRHGNAGDVVLGFSTAQEYLTDTHYFGATVGRFANRIAKGRFSLDGHNYLLATNDHGNHLHGGAHGFDKVVWRVASITSGEPATAALTYVSPDGEEGYPGTLHVTAKFSLYEHNSLQIQYEATTDKPTIVNISGHSYFDLSAGVGNGSAMTHLLQIFASRFMPVNAQLIPTGELRSVTGTAFDFRQPTAVGLRIRNSRDEQIRYGRGYDHNFVLDAPAGVSRLAARLVDPASGRVMELITTAPGLQFYSGNFLDATTSGKEDRLYRQGDALALEPQLFPDAPNQSGFPSARLNPGDVYKSSFEYRFSTVGDTGRR